MDLSSTIIPKADQMNADDLMTGPRTIKITKVDHIAGEQPVHLHYQGGEGRPYKPGKSMRRVLITMWGTDGTAYVGRRLTLYCDKSIKFGGDAVGGIRISHASDIKEPLEMPLTVTRGKRKPFRVDPLPAEKPPADAKPPRPLQELTEAGAAVAATGNDAYRMFWTKSLSEAERQLLGGADGKLHADWKTIAAAKSAT